MVGGLCFTTSLPLAPVEPVPPVPVGVPRVDLSGTDEYPFAANIQHRILPSIAEGKPYPVDTVILYHASPAYATPEPGKQVEVLKDTSRVPFLVAIDPFMGESTAYADLVLPEATYLERHDLISFPLNLSFVPYIFLRRPVIPPLYEAREVKDILRELAQRIGGGVEEYFRDTVVEYHKKELAGIPGGPTWEELVENGLWVAPGPRKTRRYEEKGFATPSGKIEIYSQRLAERGLPPYPTYQPVPGHTADERRDYPFYLITYKLPIHNQSRTANIPPLMQIQGENYLEIHPDTAGRLGIADRDLVVVDSRVGKIEIRARITRRIRPDVVAISHHFGHTHYGRTAKGRGVNPNHVIQCLDDRIGGMVAFNDTLVKIQRVSEGRGTKV